MADDGGDGTRRRGTGRRRRRWDQAPRDARDLEPDPIPDLIILDLHMHGLDGFAVGLVAKSRCYFEVTREGVHTNDRDPLGASLASETGGCTDEKSRLKAGCSQDWLPHKAASPQPRQAWHLAAGGLTIRSRLPTGCQPAPQAQEGVRHKPGPDRCGRVPNRRRPPALCLPRMKAAIH